MSRDIQTTPSENSSQDAAVLSQNAQDKSTSTPHDALERVRHAIDYLHRRDMVRTEASRMLSDIFFFIDKYDIPHCSYPEQSDATGENVIECSSESECTNEDCGMCRYHCRHNGCGEVAA